MPYALVLLVSLASALTAPARGLAVAEPFSPMERAHRAAPALARDSVRTDGEIRMTVLRNASDVRRCYEREGLRRNPRLRGLVEVEITILPTGVVEHAEVSTSTSIIGEGADELAQCIAKAARHWRFERGPFAVEIVTFPFELAPNAGSLRLAHSAGE